MKRQFGSVVYYGTQLLTDLLERGLDWLEAWHARQPRDTRPADATRFVQDGHPSARTTRARLELDE